MRGCLWLIALLAAIVPADPVHATPPRLIVLVSLDQFPREYLDRFGALFDDDGFRRLLERGADFRDCHHEHFTTSTAPGHSVMLTGAYPADTGIVDNLWYSRAQRRLVSCVEDERFPLLRSITAPVTDPAGSGVAPPASLSTTVGDALRAATAMRARVVSISIKDRAAVLMGGQRPNGAYWFDPRTCTFVTSEYYMAQLPGWAAAVNAAQPCARYVGGTWEKLRSDIEYARFADEDDAPYERDAYGLGRTFPHPVNEFMWEDSEEQDRDRDRYTAVIASPFGSEILLRLAEAAVKGEALGRDAIPDLLAVSFSSNDLVGHLFGPHSQEVLDMTLRTDRIVAALMRFLDAEVGEQQWLLVLTSDHGVAPVPEYLERIGMLPPRSDHYRFSGARSAEQVTRALTERLFGSQPPQNRPRFIDGWIGPFIYVNHGVLARLRRRVSFEELVGAVQEEVRKLDGVKRVYRRAEQPTLAASSEPVEQWAARSWHAGNGGDLLVQLHPYWLYAELPVATSHGTPYRYDTQVPMLMYGPGIRPGHFTRPVTVVDLAATLAQVLGVARAPYDRGQPLREALR